MSEPYDGYETLWAKYNDVAQENKERRKLKGQWRADEPKEFIYDESTPEAEIMEFDGEPPMIIDYDWRYSNLYSQCWVADLFGADFRTIQHLLFIRDIEMVNVGGYIYYRERFISECLEILNLLAKTNIVNILRPLPSVVKENSTPIYTSKELMRILNVKESTLRKYREDGLLGYSKSGDKIWYTQKDLDDFLYNPNNRFEAFNK